MDKDAIYVGAMERDVSTFGYDMRFTYRAYVEVYYFPQEHKIVEEIWEIGHAKEVEDLVSDLKTTIITCWVAQVEWVYTEFIQKNIETLLVKCPKCWMDKQL